MQTGAIISRGFAAISVVYSVANVIVVTEQQRVIASLTKSLSFCRQHFSTVAVLWLLILALSIPQWGFSMLAQFVTIPALPVLAAVALVNSVYTGCMFVLNLGLCTSLYLALRSAAEAAAPVPLATA